MNFFCIEQKEYSVKIDTYEPVIASGCCKKSNSPINRHMCKCSDILISITNNYFTTHVNHSLPAVIKSSLLSLQLLSIKALSIYVFLLH